MLTRVYIDNFKALVNFTLDLDSLVLLLGANGSGKSTVFEVIRLVRDFVTGQSTTGDLFHRASLTKWHKSNVQTFELFLDGRGGTFAYKLAIEHDRERDLCRVLGERLKFDDLLLYESKPEQDQLHARLYSDDGGEGPRVLVDWARSAIASIQSHPENTLLSWFKARMSRIFVLRLDPIDMIARSEKESTVLAHDGSNFVSWFRHAAQLDMMRVMSELQPVLSEALCGFDALRLVPDGGDARLMTIRFKTEDSRSTYESRFDELSEGQRALVALYSLLTAPLDEEYTLCLDEPENFVSLREVQPWLNMLIDAAQTRPLQAILISHHPELINTLASASGRWFERNLGGNVRVMPVADDGTGLSIAELVARGWIHA
jgi:energy-coupling factor transporter ATP-binding protein EcfA2